MISSKENDNSGDYTHSFFQIFTVNPPKSSQTKKLTSMEGNNYLTNKDLQFNIKWAEKTIFNEKSSILSLIGNLKCNPLKQLINH